MKPIFEFTDHRIIEIEHPSVIYFLSGNFYLGTSEELVIIEPEHLDDTNLGDPYRELALFSFKVHPRFYSDDLRISIDDAAILLAYCRYTDRQIHLGDAFSQDERFKPLQR